MLIFGGRHWIPVVLVSKSRAPLEGCTVNVVDSTSVTSGSYTEIWYIREATDRCSLINRVCGRFWMTGAVFKAIEKNKHFIHIHVQMYMQSF